MATEDKWKANLAKVAFMKQFPGLLGSWEALKGKTIEAVIPLKGKQGAAAHHLQRRNVHRGSADGRRAVRTRRDVDRRAFAVGRRTPTRIRSTTGWRRTTRMR